MKCPVFFSSSVIYIPRLVYPPVGRKSLGCSIPILVVSDTDNRNIHGAQVILGEYEKSNSHFKQKLV